jgi:hypothetical protein
MPRYTHRFTPLVYASLSAMRGQRATFYDAPGTNMKHIGGVEGVFRRVLSTEADTPHPA